MKKSAILIATIFTLFVFQIRYVEANNLVVNGNFETPFSTTGNLPTSYGIWDTDYSTSVVAENEVTPLEGNRMLKFINSGSGGASSLGACNVWQLINISSYSSLVASGKAAVTASANFNRVAGDQETDTEFILELYAFSGSPSSFPYQINNGGYLTNTSRHIFTDDDLDTWQKVNAELPLPPNTTFLAIEIASVENIVNDVSGIEFDGHYADDIKLFIHTKEEMPTVFEDNFNDGGLDGWTVGATDVGNVAIESGELSCSGEWSNSAWPASLVIDDFILEYDMKIISASGTTETYFRADNLSAAIPNGYLFSVRSGNGIALYKWDNNNNQWITLETEPFQYTLKNWYHFKIQAVNDQLQVYIDGVKRIDVTDTTYSNGNIRLGSWQDPNFGWINEHVHYDNVSIIKYNPLNIASNYEFFLDKNSQKTFSIQLANQDTISHSASLEVLTPYDDLTVSLSANNLSIAPGEVKEVPITINASEPIGIYDIQAKVIDDEGNIFYSNIKIYVTAVGEEILPNLNITSNDISFSNQNPDPNETVDLSASIHNNGSSLASNFSVKFFDSQYLLGEILVNSLEANAAKIASIPVSFSSSGSHLIRVVVDSINAVTEIDETDNEACQIFQVGSGTDMTGNILVTGDLPSTVVANSLFKVTGRAVYEFVFNGVINTDYEVKGGTVRVTIKGEDGREWDYSGIYTNIYGNFSKFLQAPEETGVYHLIMTVTDKTFTGTQELFFKVIAQPPPSPPSPPTSSGSGSWSYSSSGGTWTWEWTVPPVNEPVFESNLYVHSEDIYFSKDNPALGDEISIIAEIHYWSSSTATKGTNVPVNFYVTYPGYPKIKIGETVIPSISVGEPNYGSSHVFVSWKNQAEGIYIVEAEIDPSYIEENQLDNTATRAIIVGQLGEVDCGVISGHVTDPWGGVGGIVIDLINSDGTSMQTITDETGGYLFPNTTTDDKVVKIFTPTDCLLDTRYLNVGCNTISVVDFLIADREGPVTTNVSTDLNPVQISDIVNLTAFVDNTETGNSNVSFAEYSLDGKLTWIQMDSVDDSFDTPSESVASNFTAPETPGVYELCVRGTDSYCNIGPEECIFLVVYDPDGGFVTGGGWIDSPAGAYTADPTLTGKANFGFVSKYKKGATTPTGETEFQFKVADLNFHSDTYQWLVIAGASAKYKGTGTINGSGNYGFMLTAIDEKLTPSTDVDLFRIKIWDKDDGDSIVYDNQMEDNDDANPSTEIGGGSIVIHKAK